MTVPREARQEPPAAPALAARSVRKRALDTAVAACALLVLAMPLLLVALTIRLCMGAPVLFIHERPGLGSRPIRVCKFRTMGPAEPGRPHDPARVTPLGGVLRRFSIDELPQLCNVLTGDMSLVGPRPLLSSYLDRYSPRQARRHLVRPGMTGLAQVSGRVALSWEESLELDVWYVEHWSFRLDLKLLALTAWQLLTRTRDVAASDLTRHEFQGPGITRDRDR